MNANQKKKQTVTIIEQDGTNFHTMTLACVILSENPAFDLKKAVKDAVKDYLHTENGKLVYEHNGRRFNWADFALCVPNRICEKHGFCSIGTETSDMTVDWNEQLADDNDFDEYWKENKQ